MRFWSLKIAPSTLRHGTSCHAYIGGSSVFMPYGLLLARLPSKQPGSRQHILRLSPRPWLFEPSHPRSGLRLTTCSRGRPVPWRAGVVLLRSCCPFGVSLGSCCPPGLGGVAHR